MHGRYCKLTTGKGTPGYDSVLTVAYSLQGVPNPHPLRHMKLYIMSRVPLVDSLYHKNLSRYISIETKECVIMRRDEQRQ